MRLRLALVAIAPCVAALGCETSPESLCTRQVELTEKRFEPIEPSFRKTVIARCVEREARRKASDPKKYRCYSKCATESRDLVEWADCEPRCGIIRPSTPDEECKPPICN